MSDFTPGPWMLRTTPTSAGLCHIVVAAGWKGAFIYGDGLRKGIDDSLPKAQRLAATARLITAAPDLLEALQELCEIVEDAIEQKSAKDLDIFTLQTARAAIARATGDQL